MEVDVLTVKIRSLSPTLCSWTSANHLVNGVKWRHDCLSKSQTAIYWIQKQSSTAELLSQRRLHNIDFHIDADIAHIIVNVLSLPRWTLHDHVLDHVLFCLSFCLSVCTITAKVISRFHWNLVLWLGLPISRTDVSHCRILSPDKTEWWLISATLCRWGRRFMADQLW